MFKKVFLRSIWWLHSLLLVLRSWNHRSDLDSDMIVSFHIVPYRIVSYRIVSYRILSCPVLSCPDHPLPFSHIILIRSKTRWECLSDQVLLRLFAFTFSLNIQIAKISRRQNIVFVPIVFASLITNWFKLLGPDVCAPEAKFSRWFNALCLFQ